MSNAYIATWRQDQVELERERFEKGIPLDHTAGSRFQAAGIEPGDRVYVLSITPGDRRLLLLGRLNVERIVGKHEAEVHQGREVYHAPEHLIGSGTPLDLDRLVPEDVARRLRRASGKPVKIATGNYSVDRQTLRTPGRITDESAALLDSIL
jgi:hypothetical protein